MPDRAPVTRPFQAGDAAFIVRCPSDEVKDVVEAVFVDLESPTGSVVVAELLLETEDDGRMSVSLDGAPQSGPMHPSSALSRLVTVVTRLALDAGSGRLHLHCAALSYGDRGLLISAESGTGKTTLAAALLQRGWAYVSDEAVALSLGNGVVASGFPKPLTVKSGLTDLLPGLERSVVMLQGDGPDPRRNVPASSLNVGIVPKIDPSVVVILRRAADGSVDLAVPPRPMHPADAVVALMSQTMDAERFGPATLEVLTRLAAACSCVELLVGPLPESAAALERLVIEEPQTYPVKELRAEERVDLGGWRAAEPVRSFMVGERVVLHVAPRGAIAALDDAGSAVWRSFYGSAPEWFDVATLQTPSAQNFFAQLAEHGFVVNHSLGVSNT